MNGVGGTMLSTHVEIMESLGRLGVALALGSVIGFERQWRQKIAGLRTNALVALGSCGFVVFSAMVGEGDPTLDGTCRDLLFRHTDVQKRGRSAPAVALASCTFAGRVR